MTAPAPGLPQDVAITLAVYTEAVRENAVIPFTVGHLDSRESALLAALRAAILAAMRAATEGSGAASAASAASAAHVAPGGEPVAWGVFDGVRRLDTRRDTEAEARNTAAAWNGSGVEGAPFTVAPLFTRPAPPVSASFDAALAAIDVEPVISLYDHVTQYDILGLDDVRAAHAEAVRVAVEAERARCMADCERVARRVPVEAVDDADYAFRGAAGACVDEIRARGAKS